MFKTFQTGDDGRKLIRDTVAVHAGEKLKIGSCTSCSEDDTLGIYYDSLGLYYTQTEYKLIYRKALMHYLTHTESGECMVYVFQ